MKHDLKTIVIGTAVALSVPFGAFAISLVSQADMSLAVSPELPRPGENIRVEARSYVFNPVSANMQWYLNGNVVASGVGITEQIFTAGKAGSVMAVKVEAIASDGAAYESSATIPIGDVDLIARALTYAPVGYRGANLPSPGSVLEIYAIPYLYSAGVKISPKNLIYEWFVNDQKIISQSGGGRSRLSVDLPNLGGANHKIYLKVSSASGAIGAERRIVVPARNPEMIFYKNDSLSGRGVLALSGFSVPAGSAFSIIAEPYFMALDSLSKAAAAWFANGQNITQESQTPRILDISSPSGSAGGTTDFSFSMTDAKKLFQTATGNLTVTAQ